MILSKYAKLRILALSRSSKGPTAIVKALETEQMNVSRKNVSLFINRYACMTIHKINNVYMLHCVINF